ncbi:MAG: hypothetical protein IKS69_00920 [Erysipelotrichaceae bacterium]|nr:hypothetical protein [Erysipelotrichaceae bacterium]
MKILHLYPDLMNLYGDHGNITILVRHLKDLNIPVTVETRDIAELVDFPSYDLVYMGSGTERNQLVALKELKNYEYQLNEYISSNKLLLLTGNAMELLGQRIDDEPALNLLDFYTETTDKRFTGDVIVKNDTLGEVVGFINKSSLIHGGEEDKLFTYEFRDSNLVDNDYEGYHFNNVYGTHIIGPVLVKNPSFLNLVVRSLARSQYRGLEYPYETAAYETTLKALKNRK